MKRAGWLNTTVFCIAAAQLLGPVAHADPVDPESPLALAPYMVRIVHALHEIRSAEAEGARAVGYREGAPTTEYWQFKRTAAREEIAAVLKELDGALPPAFQAQYDRARGKSSTLLGSGIISLAQLNYAFIGGVGTLFALSGPSANISGILWGGALGSLVGSALLAAKSYFMPLIIDRLRPMQRMEGAIPSGVMGAVMGGIVGSNLAADAPLWEVLAQASLWGWAFLYATDLHYRWHINRERELFIKNNVITALQEAGGTAEDLAWLQAKLPRELSDALKIADCVLSLQPTSPPPTAAAVLVRVHTDVDDEDEEEPAYSGNAERGSSRQP